MRRIFHNEKLPKISKSIIVKENLLNDPFNQRRSSYSSADIQHHRLFRKRIVRLKEQKMKYIIDRNKSKFFNQENSLSEISSIRSNKEEKNATFFDLKINKKNDTDNISISKSEDTPVSTYFLPITIVVGSIVYTNSPMLSIFTLSTGTFRQSSMEASSMVHFASIPRYILSSGSSMETVTMTCELLPVVDTIRFMVLTDPL